MSTRQEIAAAVGNSVRPGRPEAGPEVCNWIPARPPKSTCC
jgi:hypothetical protein